MSHFNGFPKRGRPRASFAQTGELDLSLIREFRNRPALYDRKLARFKDKSYTASQWQEISNKLGYDVALLKDRMLQLRNRYNLEKRRLEQLRDDGQDAMAFSPWPLFEYLHFLSDHIRSRRSYKHMMLPHSSMVVSTELSNDDSNSAGDEEMELAAGETNAGANNGLADVKLEPESESDSETNYQNGKQDATTVLNPPALKRAALNIPKAAAKVLRAHATIQTRNATAIQHQQQQQQQDSSLNLLPPTITIRRLDSLQQQQQQQQQHHESNRTAVEFAQPHGNMRQQQQLILKPPHLQSKISQASQTQLQQQQQQQLQRRRNRSQNGSYSTHVAEDEDDDAEETSQSSLPSKRKRSAVPQTVAIVDKRTEKYRAFGEFISSSLLDLPQQKALRLVEKFTIDLVQTLMRKHEVSANKISSNGAAVVVDADDDVESAAAAVELSGSNGALNGQ